MSPSEASLVAQLIFESTNHWYESKGFGKIFQGQPKDCLVFCEVYEDLDPGCCLIAVANDTKAIIGSCFYHPRENHVSLGIMNATRDCGFRGVAKALLSDIVEIAQSKGQSLRLISSAFNLDSFSLYSKQGFAPYAVYQDMILEVPEKGLDIEAVPGLNSRAARMDDIDSIHELESAVWKTSRRKDWAYFIENQRNIWSASVVENQAGKLLGALASVNHPGSNLLGPGIANNTHVAKLLIQSELNNHRGRSPVFLIPSKETELVSAMYSMGARNCELHLAQSLGPPPEINGIVLPTFMPETG